MATINAQISRIQAVDFTFDPAAHAFWKQGKQIPSVTQILAKGGLCDYSFVDEETREYSLARGMSVHWLTQLEDEGALDYRRVPKAMRGYRKGWNTWKKRSGFKASAIEHKFVSRYGFAGIIDRIGNLYRWGYHDTGKTVVDIKTGQVADHVKYQLAAYSMGASGDDPARACRVRRIALRLNDDGAYQVKEFPPSEWGRDWARFIAAAREQ